VIGDKFSRTVTPNAMASLVRETGFDLSSALAQNHRVDERNQSCG